MKYLFILLATMIMMVMVAFSQTWTPVNIGGYTNNLNSIWFNNPNKGYIVGDYFYAIYDGVTWTTKQITSMVDNYTSICFVNDSVGYVTGYKYSNIYKTTDAGITWTYYFISPYGLRNMFFINTNIGIAVGDNGAIVRTTDGGNRWNSIPSQNISTGYNLYGVHFSTNGFLGYIVADKSRNVYKSTDQGLTWYRTALLPQGCIASHGIEISEDGSKVFVVYTHGLAISTDSGTTWVRKILVNPGYQLRDIKLDFATGKGMLIGDTVLVTNDWFNTTQGQSGVHGNSCFLLPDQSGWIIDSAGVVFRNNHVTKVEIVNNAVPHGYVLYQSYPNPFNPVTAISYTLPQKGMVSLTIVNLLGQEMATLVNSEQLAGTYKITFNASHLSSGVYFARLKSGSYNGVQKMILSK
jgi:Uncharacterized protein related to plant photosystem II stability/assembly factor